MYKDQHNTVTKSKRFTEEEDRLLIEKYKELGPRWVKISEFIPGRTGCQIKNRWHKELKNITHVSHNYTKQERRSKRAKYGEYESKSCSSESDDCYSPAVAKPEKVPEVIDAKNDSILDSEQLNKLDGFFDSIPELDCEYFLF